MNMIQFADTNEKISAMGLGCLPFGSKLDRPSSFALLDRFAEEGGTVLDTANNYSFWEEGSRGGESESVLGEWFTARGNRDRCFLATKLGAFPTVSRAEFFAYKGDPWQDKTQGLSAKTIAKAVDESLARLKTDRIDLLYAHVDDRRTDQEETLAAFDAVVRSGKVRHIGCSNFKVWRIARAREISRHRGFAAYRAYQGFDTYFQSEKFANTGIFDQMGEELFDYVGSHPMTLFGYTPLLWGSYTRPEKYAEIPRLKHFERPQNAERRLRLERVAGETGWTVNQVIYAWMLSRAPAVVPLVAVSKMEHLAEDLAAADLRLPEELLAVLDAPLD